MRSKFRDADQVECPKPEYRGSQLVNPWPFVRKYHWIIIQCVVPVSTHGLEGRYDVH